MSNVNDSAFPKDELINDPGGIGVGLVSHGGLTKREYFAAMAMQGMFSHGPDAFNGSFTPVNFARQSCKAADALLAELAKTGEL